MKKKFNITADLRGHDRFEIIDAILRNRGIKDIDDFLKPCHESFIMPCKMRNMHKAYSMINEAVWQNKKIRILADTDCDGCTANAIVYRLLRHDTDNVDFVINDGKEHGIKNYNDFVGVDTLIIVDSIEDSYKPYQLLFDMGVHNIIILDHHNIVSDILEHEGNPNFAIVSSQNSYDNPELTGAGVALKFACYYDDMELTSYSDELYDLAACGIVADSGSMMSMENRYIVYRGLNEVHNLGIQKIIGTYEFNSTAISYSVAPLVNACVRMHKNMMAATIFSSDDEDEIADCIKIAKKCKDQQSEMVDFALQNKDEKFSKWENNKCLFYFIEKEYKDVGGLIANRILQEAKRPVFVIHYNDDGGISGSMRAVGVEKFADIVNSKTCGVCRGHDMAAGFTIENASDFNQFVEQIENALNGIEFEESIVVDAKLDMTDITEDLARNIKILNRISGKDYPPISIIVETKSFDVSSLSNGKHTKISADNDMLFLKWNDDFWKNGKESECFVGVGTLDVSFFGRKKTIQMILDEYDWR